MMQLIKQQEVLGKDFKIYGDFENPLFLAKDVAEWIEHSRPSEMLKSIDTDEKLMQTILASGQHRNMWFLTEDGLYEVLMQSRKPIAKEFKKQVKNILKDVRKNGMYATDKILNNPDLLIGIATKLKIEREEKLKLTEIVINQNQELLELKPKATYYDLVLNGKDLISVTAIAKDFGMSALKLNQILHNKKIQFKQGDVWFLYQKYADRGYTSTKTHSYNNSKGEINTRIHTHWTQKGRLFIYELLKKDGILPNIEQHKTA